MESSVGGGSFHPSSCGMEIGVQVLTVVAAIIVQKSVCTEVVLLVVE